MTTSGNSTNVQSFVTIFYFGVFMVMSHQLVQKFIVR